MWDKEILISILGGGDRTVRRIMPLLKNSCTGYRDRMAAVDQNGFSPSNITYFNVFFPCYCLEIPSSRELSNYYAAVQQRSTCEQTISDFPLLTDFPNLRSGNRQTRFVRTRPTYFQSQQSRLDLLSYYHKSMRPSEP